MFMSAHRRRAALAAVFVFAGAPLAVGQTVHEDRKFTAPDGTTSEYFGASVAIDGSIIAVGAYGRDVNGVETGAVFLFDAPTGAQTFELVPSDGAERE